MNTQYQKRSIYLASANYRIRQRKKRLKGSLAVFFALLSAVSAALYIMLSSINF